MNTIKKEEISIPKEVELLIERFSQKVKDLSPEKIELLKESLDPKFKRILNEYSSFLQERIDYHKFGGKRVNDVMDGENKCLQKKRKSKFDQVANEEIKSENKIKEEEKLQLKLTFDNKPLKFSSPGIIVSYLKHLSSKDIKSANFEEIIMNSPKLKEITIDIDQKRVKRAIDQFYQFQQSR